MSSRVSCEPTPGSGLPGLIMGPDVRWRQPSRRRSPTALPFPKRYAMHRNIPGRRSSTLIGPAWDNWCRTACSGPARKSGRMNKPVSGLYAVTPELTDSNSLVSKVDGALRGGARVIQYRSKTIPDSLRRSQAGAIARLCRNRNVLFIVNDSMELAREVDADGRHLGREDGDVVVGRAVLGSGKLVGGSFL